MQTVDPTRIDIYSDPTTRRMKGVAYHGNTPFDVPFISKLNDNLWQGGCTTDLILPDFIDHVVSLYPWERYTIKHEVQSELYIKMYDSLDQSVGLVNELAEYVNERRKTGQVLVHCQAGLNRSSLIASRALFLQYLDDPIRPAFPEEIVKTIRALRSPACLCNPAFEAEVMSWKWPDMDMFEGVADGVPATGRA